MTYTPTLEQIIDQAIDDRLTDMNTCIPAIVESYNPATQTAMIKIALKKKYPSGELVDRPVIPDVPVMFPKAGKFSLTFPLKKDDDGLLIFSQRSIERWRAGSGIVDPRDARKFNLSDCFFYPTDGRDDSPIPNVSADKTRLADGKSLVELSESGTILVKNDKASIELNASGLLQAKNEVATVDLNSAGLIELKNAQGKIRITANGKFKIEGAKELLEIIGRFIDTMSMAETLTALGPQPFLPPTIAELVQLKADILSITE